MPTITGTKITVAQKQPILTRRYDPRNSISVTRSKLQANSAPRPGGS